MFTNDGQDVLYVAVDSPALHELHDTVKRYLPNQETHPDYHPHVTIAYLKTGRAARYLGGAIRRTVDLAAFELSPPDDGAVLDIHTRHDGGLIYAVELLCGCPYRYRTPVLTPVFSAEYAMFRSTRNWLP